MLLGHSYPKLADFVIFFAAWTRLAAKMSRELFGCCIYDRKGKGRDESLRLACMIKKWPQSEKTSSQNDLYSTGMCLELPVLLSQRG